MFIRFKPQKFLKMKWFLLNILNFQFYLSHYYRRWTFVTFLLIAIGIFIFSIVPHLGFDDPTSSSADDLHLPQSLQCPHKNNIKLEYGRSHLAHSRVIICGLIHDREQHIHRLRQQIEEITPIFADYAIVIVESDSKDRTRYELIRWAQDKKVANRIHIIGCGNRASDDRPCNLLQISNRSTAHPDTPRIKKMVRLRNIYMQYIEDDIQLSKFDYVIVQDFDLRTYTYIDGLLSTGFHFGKDSTIDAICANGINHHRILGRRRYYDPYAHKDEQNKDWSVWFNDQWSAIFRKYSCSTGLVSVQSCFSGATMYRYTSIKGKRYRTYIDSYQQSICEHVGFHETINNMYLNSEMIFYVIKNH
ncbi:unnamed protein product [Rotaria sp. Silwood2]|nr:unnamed protein product [Rotaria sp. Silwood2]CAF3260154.1 unnamed protein product [Rotaria sp. Silwood2]CAF4217231.1 unnamed protein product [Rotaria sp. Silwood2]